MSARMVATVAAVVMAMAAAGWAQDQRRVPPGGGPPAGSGMLLGRFLSRLATDPEIAEELGLTAEQTAKLKALWEEIKTPREELSEKLREAEEKNRKLFESESPDETALLEGVEQAGKLRIEMAKLEVKSVLAVRAVLTPEQIQTLKDRIRERMRDRVGEWREAGRRATGGDRRQPPPPPPPPASSAPPAPPAPPPPAP